MNVQQLIDILKDYPQDTEIEMAIVAPVGEDDQIAVDRYPVEGVLPWEDDEEGGHDQVIWLVGGEDDDVETFMDAIEDDDHDHDHADGHDHANGHGHGHGHGHDHGGDRSKGA